jgi:argininosuccinate lyase
MKLWQKETTLNQKIETFTIGQDGELDLQLARYDVQGSLAHIEMLCSIGLIKNKELNLLKIELQNILESIDNQSFEIEPEVEDVHSQIELLLIRKLGDVGKKIHAGRSRNDQVLVDLRLFFRAEIREIIELSKSLFTVLQDKSEAHKDDLMPGYTHTQVAMVSSFGLWFGAYAESWVDVLQLFQSVHQIVNQNPLGSAAGYGSSFPLNRTMTTELLEFDNLAYNVIHAQMGRGKTELFLSFGIAALATTLGKLAADICLFNSQNFSFFKLPDEFTTGSSIMPHKKNPDVFELIRGRCNLLANLPNQVTALTGNLISGYHRDFQLLKEIMFPALTNLKNCLEMAAFAIPEISVKKDLLKDEKYDLLYTVEAVNEEVMKGIPFRDAYLKVGKTVENGSFKWSKKIVHTHEGSLGNLCNDAILEKMKQVKLGRDE